MLPKNTRIGILAPIAWDIPAQSYAPWERVVYNLGKGLVAEGYTHITLFSTKEAYIPGVKTVSLFSEPHRDRFPEKTRAYELLHIAHSLKHAVEHCDIIHNNLNYHPLLFSSLIDIPIITTLHGSSAEPEAQEGYRAYKHLPFVSSSTSERTILPELNYVATIPHPIDFEKCALGAKTKTPYLAYAGRLHPTKGIVEAIELATRVNIPLRLAGPIPAGQESYFKNFIEPAMKNGRVVWLGNLAPKEVHTLISGALAYIGLINFEEPFGLSIAEAMASGTPVIGTPRGSQKELIIDGVTGILVDSVSEAAERFTEILTIDRKRCRASAQERFNIPVVAKKYLDVYEAVLRSLSS